MDFKKKMIIRIILAAGFILFGIELIYVNLKGLATNSIIPEIGAVYILCGIVRLIQYLMVIKNDKKFEKRRIEENDERNIMIRMKAQSATFVIYVILSTVAMILLYLADKEFVAQIISYTICAFVLIYFVCYHIVKRRY
jgi:hypothetical protein